MRQAWDELLLIQREQQRYSDIKYDLEQDLEHCKKKQSKLEDVIYFIIKLLIRFSKKNCFFLGTSQENQYRRGSGNFGSSL